MKTLSEIVKSLLRSIFQIRVTFEDGTWIEFLNKEAVLYEESDGRRMEISSYFKPGRMRDRVVYTNDMKKWRVPYESEEVSIIKQTEIRNKLIRYAQRKRISVEIKDA